MDAINRLRSALVGRLLLVGFIIASDVSDNLLRLEQYYNVLFSRALRRARNIG